MALSDTACRTAKVRQADYKLSDGGGLYLLVKPSGTRLLEPGIPVQREAEEALPRRLSVRIPRRGAPAA